MNASLIAVCLVALSTVACSGAADIPATPDLRALLQEYQRPTASLDGSTVNEALKSAPPNVRQLAAGLEALKYVVKNVDYASGNTTAPNAGGRLRLQGSLRLDIRCPGERTDPVYDETINGSVSLTAAVADNRILRGLGGEANACVLQGTVQGITVRVELDGPIAFDLGGDIGVGQYWTGELLASLPGTLTIAGSEFRSISARLTQGRFQYLVNLPDKAGSIVLELSDAGITIRDGVGVWFCAEGQSCAKQ